VQVSQGGRRRNTVAGWQLFARVAYEPFCSPGCQPADAPLPLVLCAVVILMLYYLIPLSTMWEIVKTKNAASIYPPLALASIANGVLWTIYGFDTKVRDPSPRPEAKLGVGCVWAGDERFRPPACKQASAPAG
jgi:hypothetical protein